MIPPKVPEGKLLPLPSGRRSRLLGEGESGAVAGQGTDFSAHRNHAITPHQTIGPDQDNGRATKATESPTSASRGTPLPLPSNMIVPIAGGVPPLRGTPRRGQTPPSSPATPMQTDGGGFRLVAMESWERVSRDAVLFLDELLQQLLSLYQKYPREFLGGALVTGLIIFLWPAPPDDEFAPSGISMRGLRQRFAFTQAESGDGRAAEEDVLNLDDINALLARFERRTRVVSVAAYRQGPRSVRTVRARGIYDQSRLERELPAPSPRHLTHSDREALTAHVLRVISRHGKRGVDRRSLAGAIVSEALRQNYDPLFVAAVIKSESAFNTYARSYVGAQGLMQIMPATARYVESINEIPRGNLSDPGHNLHLGVKYLKYLEAMYKGNRVLTLMAYNWGPGHVDKTIKGGSRRGVPREVVNYALRILGDHARWVDEVNQQTSRSKAT